MSGSKTWMIIGGVVGCLGCGGVLTLGVGIFLLGAETTSTAPVVAPTAPAVPVAPPAAAGTATYTHQGRCPNAPNLTLEHFQLAHSTQYTVLGCTQMEPRPFGYVNFHAEDASGNMRAQITIGYANGPVTIPLLAAAADDLTRQLGSMSQEVNTAPLAARGASLLRRDATFQVPQQLGTVAAGTYVVRQVVVPQPADPRGLTVMMLRPVPDGNVAQLLATSEPELRQVVESIRF